MVTNLPAIGAPFVLQAADLAQLFPSLQRRGYQVVGPAIRGSAIVYDTLNSFEELPASAATLAGIRKLTAAGTISASADVVAVLTGNLLKDPDYIYRYHTGKLEDPDGAAR